MNYEIVLSYATLFVSFILGLISKKVSWVSNKIIPLQNLVVGLVVAIVYWIYTKDFSAAIITAGLLAGGTYDLLKNLTEILTTKINNAKNKKASKRNRK